MPMGRPLSSRPGAGRKGRQRTALREGECARGPQEKRKGRTPSSRTFPLSRLRTGMPIPEWNREYPRQVTSDLVPESSPHPEPGDDINANEVEPQAHSMGATYYLGRFIITPLARVLYRPHIEGRSLVPKSGPVIFASNHLSFLDSIAIPVAAPRPVHFLAKASYFDSPGFKGWASRQFFTAIGAIPVQRGAGQAALDALA